MYKALINCYYFLRILYERDNSQLDSRERYLFVYSLKLHWLKLRYRMQQIQYYNLTGYEIDSY